MRRRSFLKGLLGAAALVAAPGVPGVLVPERRIWALDRTMTGSSETVTREPVSTT